MRILTGIINRIREWAWGRCPYCGSLRLKDVEGWRKSECKDCGKMWNR